MKTGQDNSVKNGNRASNKQSSLHDKSMPGQKRMRPDKGMLGVKTALKAKGVAKQKRGRKAKQAAPERVAEKAAQHAQQTRAQQAASKAPADKLIPQPSKFPANKLHGNRERHHASKTPADETLVRKGASEMQQARPPAAAKVPGQSSPSEAKQAPAAQALRKKRASQTQQGPGEATPGRQAKRSAAEPAQAEQHTTLAGQAAADVSRKDARKRPKPSAVRACGADQQDAPLGQLSGSAAPQKEKSNQLAADPAQNTCKAAQASPDGMLRGKKRNGPAADPCLPDQEASLAEQAAAAQPLHHRDAKEPAAKQSHAKAKARQGDALKAAREKGISGKGWQSRAKSHMLGCLDIDFCEWDAADIARQWRRLMRQEAGAEVEGEHSHSSDGTAPDGACTSAAACASGSSHPHEMAPPEAFDIEAIARDARLKRKLVAIPDELLADLDQAEDSSEVVAEPVEQVLSQERPVDVEDCRSYPSRLMREDGDMPLEEWMRKEADGTLPSGDYVVTAIVAERTRPGSRARQFLVKWKGFELNPDQWLPLKQLQHCTALDAWQQSRNGKAMPDQSLPGALQARQHAATGNPPHHIHRRKAGIHKARMCKASKM